MTALQHRAAGTRTRSLSPLLTKSTSSASQAVTKTENDCRSLIWRSDDALPCSCINRLWQHSSCGPTPAAHKQPAISSSEAPDLQPTVHQDDELSHTAAQCETVEGVWSVSV